MVCMRFWTICTHETLVVESQDPMNQRLVEGLQADSAIQCCHCVWRGSAFKQYENLNLRAKCNMCDRICERLRRSKIDYPQKTCIYLSWSWSVVGWVGVGLELEWIGLRAKRVFWWSQLEWVSCAIAQDTIYKTWVVFIVNMGNSLVNYCLECVGMYLSFGPRILRLSSVVICGKLHRHHGRCLPSEVPPLQSQPPRLSRSEPPQKWLFW